MILFEKFFEWIEHVSLMKFYLLIYIIERGIVFCYRESIWINIGCYYFWNSHFGHSNAVKSASGSNYGSEFISGFYIKIIYLQDCGMGSRRI